MKFQKGKSGNPGGKKSESDDVKAAKIAIQKLCPDAVDKLMEFMDNKKLSVQMWAVDKILQYSIPKPAQEVDLGNGDGTPLRATLLIEYKPKAESA